jgi:hypothetical protein
MLSAEHAGEVSWLNIYNRPLYAGIVGGGAAFGIAMGHQPLIWTAAALIAGFVLGWLIAPRKKDA